MAHFNKRFFATHQTSLLWLLNHPIVGAWFRWALRIHGDRSAAGGARIDRILPNAIFWRNASGHKQAEFRIHNKFAKRLYHAFWPVWAALHFWDWLIADRWQWAWRWSFGFASWGPGYPDPDPESSTVDGAVELGYSSGSGVSWSSIRGAANGSAAYPSDADIAVFWLQCDTVSNMYKGLSRAFYLFDTSTLPDTAAIDVAVMSIYGTAKVDDGHSPAACIVATTPASNTNLVVGDYDQIGSTQLSNAITYANWSTTGYNAFTLNSSGRAVISKTGITKLGARESNFDLPNTAPTWSNGRNTYLTGYAADQTGTTNDPKLVITYDSQTSFSQSPIIASATLTTGSISRTPSATGSDLWTMVESNDGHMYATWGDGGGFAGSDANKVEWGLARIEGSYGSRAGYNVVGGLNPEQAVTPISTSGAAPGIKCDSMISVDGVLYFMFFDWGSWFGSSTWSAKLAKTTNKGASFTQYGGGTLDNSTWDWSSQADGAYAIGWFQIGADYDDCSDGYVYGYSYPVQMTPSPAPVYACRVATLDIMNKASYTYRQSNGSWGAFGTAEAMFTITSYSDYRGWYHPGLQRYFLTFPTSDVGDWTWLDAPNPWGPWTRVGNFSSWIDSQYKFGFVAPAKWNSGLNFDLVFSGVNNGAVYDAFCTVPGYFTVVTEQEGFRFRNDDGSESAATWKAAQDANINLPADTAARLRILINATGDPASKQFQLEYRRKPSGGSFGGWNKVNQ